MKFVIGHIAPCGINCATCVGFQREKNKCSGCNSETGKKANHCYTCIIKNCDLLAATDSKLCLECNKYPCTRLKQLDKRYRTNYKTSLIDNLNKIKNMGIEEFLKSEETKWRCGNCGEIICIHRGICLNCSNQN